MNTSYFIARVVRWAAPLTTLVAAVIASRLFGAPLAVLTLASGAFVLVIWLLWSSVQALTGETELSFEEAFSLGTRSAEEEQKRAVLRALKDLEYERSIGKISEDDYHEYSARYRAEAKRLIQSLDENLAEGRQQVERELERRLQGKAPAAAEKPAEPVPSTEEPAEVVVETAEKPEKAAEIADDADGEEAEATPRTRECPACQTKNELDALFCKRCGKGMSEVAEGES